MDNVFETERMFARPWSVDDAAEAWVMYGDPEVVRYIGGELVADVAQQRERLATILERNAGWGGRYGSWPLIERASGTIVGTAILKPPPVSGTGGKSGEHIEIGWHVVRRRWGEGFATESGRALLRHGFVTLALPKLHAVVETPNHRSMAVARRIGMQHRGLTDRWYDRSLELFDLDADIWFDGQTR